MFYSARSFRMVTWLTRFGGLQAVGLRVTTALGRKVEVIDAKAV